MKPKRSRKRRSKKSKSSKGCNCTKSKCLRLHCVCFRNGRFCGPECGCECCYNTVNNVELVQDVRKATLEINSEAFKSPFVEVEVNGKIQRFTKGCSCSKNNCQKNYCECFKNGLACSPLCKCTNCKNEKCELDPETAGRLSKKSSRKKKKIVFTTVKGKDLRMTKQVLVSRHSKR